MIYLASQSPRRKQILELTGLEFTVKPTNTDESGAKGMTPKNTVEYLSKIKAEALFCDIAENDVIIGSDTVVAIDGEILGKPKNEADAKVMLKKLSGRTHHVFTGVTLIKKTADGRIEKTFSCVTEVEFFSLLDDEINAYVKTGEPLDKAGAYGIQEKGALFVKGINGDFFNVVGLPVSALWHELKSLC